MEKNSYPGKFICFEGIDHSGKRTQLHNLRKWLGERGSVVKWLSEPNNESSPMGKYIRRVLQKELPMPELFEFQRLYVIDRAQDIHCFINPHLQNGHFMLVERYAHSTIAYGISRGLTAEDYINLHCQVIGPYMLWPDVAYFIDIPAEVAIERIKLERSVPELFEKKQKLEQVRKNYLQLARRRDIGNIVVIDGNRSKEDVFAEILSDFQSQFGII